MKNISYMIIILLLTRLTISFSCEFMPKNNLKIYKDNKNINSLTKDKFDSIIKRIFENFSPVINKKGATLQIIGNWDDPTVNAYADREANIWKVTMYGGFACHPLITEDGLMLVICHELAHHIGGIPKYNYGYEWAAAEGQADYFGSLKCLKRIFEQDNNTEIISKILVDNEVTNQCKLVYKSNSEIALCQRISMAGKSLGEFLAKLSDAPKVSFATPDKSKVKKTIYDHPWPQCRLDTFFSGALCDKSFIEDVSDSSTIPGTCIQRDGYTKGIRPLCWYRPSTEEI